MPSKEELLKMFNLDKGLSKSAPAPSKPALRMEAPQVVRDRDNCLILDEWDQDRGMVMARKLGNPESDHLSQSALADLHGVCFKPDPQFAEGCKDENRERFIKTLLESSEFAGLKASTTLVVTASERAAYNLAEELGKVCEAEKHRKPKPDSAKEERAKAGAFIRAVAKGVDKTEKEVEEMDGICHAMGMGEGMRGHNLAPEQLAELFNKVRNNPVVRRICELAGRYRLSAQSKQRNKVVHGYDDMVGLCLDDTLGLLLPEELMLLGEDDELGLDAARRLMERETLAFDYRSIEKVAKGSILITTDESGSMHGEPNANAKAFALAMAWIARKQNRWCGLVGYSGGDPGLLLTLPPHKWDELAVLEWMAHFYGRGSDRDVPVVELPDFYRQMKAPKGKTDLVMITDAICHLDAGEIARFNDWRKEEKVHSIALIIGREAGDLKQVCDEVYYQAQLGVENEGVEKCLSI